MKVNNYNEDQASDVHQFDKLGKQAFHKVQAKAGSAKWLVAALLLLIAIPLAFGGFRLIALYRGTDFTPVTARFFAYPLPIVLHLLSIIVYAILSPFQFATGFRRRRPGWHRVAGRIAVISGLLVGLSALWMTLFYPREPDTGELLYASRLLFGSAMVVFIILGFSTILRGDVIQHRAWMIRSYAIGIGAGTQVVTVLAGTWIFGPQSVLGADLLESSAWVINLIVAEWVIRKRPSRPSKH